MSDRYDPDERFALDMDPDDALRKLLETTDDPEVEPADVEDTDS